MTRTTPLQRARQHYQPRLPQALSDLLAIEIAAQHEKSSAEANVEEIRSHFPKLFGKPILRMQEGGRVERSPLRVGVVLSGGQAAGGHNVISGLYDALKEIHSDSQLFGFLQGPSGVIENKVEQLTAETIARYRNQGGFDMIGSGRTKIETQEQLAASAHTLKQLKLDGLVIIGGDDSNTNAALLAEYLLDQNLPVSVVGVPKTIDGDLKGQEIEISFGHDTACRIYSEMVGNLMSDALSAKKYYHFVKLMGRSASHIALECALQTHPNLTLIGEEVHAGQQTLQGITEEIADLICARAEQHKHYGVILIPEGLIEFIPEVGRLIGEINRALAEGVTANEEKMMGALSFESARCFSSLPKEIRQQLLADRDPHGNVQVAHIATEQLLIQTVSEELDRRHKLGEYSGTFSALSHYFGYEGRSALPSNFDANYCYALGQVAALLIAGKRTGYMAALQALARPVEEWIPKGVPLTMMMRMEERKGKYKPVIHKYLVDLEGAPFLEFRQHRREWAMGDDYGSPGPIQFFGDRELTDALPIALTLEQSTRAVGTRS